MSVVVVDGWLAGWCWRELGGVACGVFASAEVPTLVPVAISAAFLGAY